MNDVTTSAETVGRALQLLEQLKEVLEREMGLMRERRTEELLEVSNRKAEIVEDLNRVTPRLEPLLETRDSLSRTAMMLLRTTLSFDDVTLYDAKGDLAERREARSFGHV